MFPEYLKLKLTNYRIVSFIFCPGFILFQKFHQLQFYLFLLIFLNFPEYKIFSEDDISIHNLKVQQEQIYFLHFLFLNFLKIKK